MDGTRFDELVKGISSKRLTRLSAIRGLATGAVAAVTGVSLFAAGTEASDKGPASNPKKKKKTICHCTNSNAATCYTKRMRPKSAKKHLKHGCDYEGACTGRSGCPATSSGAQPAFPTTCLGIACTGNGDCNTQVPGCTCLAPETPGGPRFCGIPDDTCPAEECSDEAQCTGSDPECTCLAPETPGGPRFCGIPDDTCTADECSDDTDCNASVDGCRCLDIDDDTHKGTCGIDDTCPADECSGDYDCNTYVDGCKCRDKDEYTGKRTCGTKSDV